MLELKSKSNHNSSRLFGLDIARLLAMLMMVQGHTIFCLINESILNSGSIFWSTWTFIRGFTAPVFLMVSGIVHVFANKRAENGKLPFKTIKKRLRVCFMLLFVGYLLQLPANNLYDLPFLSIDLIHSLFKVNVLQLFAASLLLLMLLFVITKSNKQLAVLAFAFGNLLIILSHFTLQVDWAKILPVFLSPYLTMTTGSIFPLAPFSGYLFIGVGMGCLLEKVPSSSRNRYIITRFFLIGLPYLFAGILISYLYNHGQLTAIGQVTPNAGVSLYRVGVSLLVCAGGTVLSYFLGRFQDIISMFSKRSLFIYVGHLLIIYGTPISPGLRHIFYQVDTFTAFYSALFVIFFSSLLAWIYENTYKIATTSYFYKYFIVALLIYMLLI